MKYYAVTEDPRELYHYGVKGMKWGQHIFGDKPKSPGYHKAVKKLKSLSAKASKATAKSISTVGQTVKKSAQQMLYNARAAQQKRFNKAIERSQKRYDKIDQKIENYYANKPVKDAKKQAAVNSVKQGASAVASFVRKAPGQIAYAARKHEENRYQKAVQKAQDRNKLSDALRGLDKEEKLIKQVNRDRKMEELREKHADIMADNDLKTMQKAVRVEKNMPKYYQEARTGQLKYGKLSDEQIGRLQNRLALEANTRRLGSTEEPSWREQKKQARRQGYLQGITKGVSAGMEEVARAGVQYGIRNLANRKKMDTASELKAEREKNANRIKNRKSHSEMRQDVKDEAYKSQVEAGVHAVQRGSISTRGAARQLQYAKNLQAAREERLVNNAEVRALDRAARFAQKYGYLPASASNGGGGKGNKGNNKPQYHQNDIANLKKYADQKFGELNNKSKNDEKPFDLNAALAEAQQKHEQQQAAAKRKQEEFGRISDAVDAEIERRSHQQELLKEGKRIKGLVNKANSAHSRTEKYKRLKQEQIEMKNNPNTTREQIEANKKEVNAILAEIAKERIRKKKAGLS